jgi:hypothetical protein
MNKCILYSHNPGPLVPGPEATRTHFRSDPEEVGIDKLGVRGRGGELAHGPGDLISLDSVS